MELLPSCHAGTALQTTCLDDPWPLLSPIQGHSQTISSQTSSAGLIQRSELFSGPALPSEPLSPTRHASSSTDLHGTTAALFTPMQNVLQPIAPRLLQDPPSAHSLASTGREHVQQPVSDQNVSRWYRCPVPGCHKSYPVLRSLTRHQRSKHSSRPTIRCCHPDCRLSPHTYARPDILQRHIRRRHQPA